ncbi:hypothetical protein [Aggregatibacter actinomycetemcomitans]|uniref:hypothetical protein n=1 Tax=Aggregatibacter actinomycetemcomitans TaxID=714 RepID=UPI00077E4E20|nr:hypothetical protein [Aggregatibacter actinomycetemcomitans]KYK81135.1 hypothetical protein SC936_05100 [Aggregatibacter actinomycetemcomitans serotype e str. SC936]MBN6058883.1 hypothetical protein [Aggregatibacter actinomycetemcomitans]MBN6059024.1 hypothetical protein [Aggregatibacter actinomycetemcomitans]MBN6087350.1 hypothetical protein [Aggregatibacter actinomycetemcomitans]MBN6087525.1 hypothetical protein [Aggregatibacter actinomycetemcomitans]
MNEQTLIRINAQLCVNDRGCSDVNLNLSQSEALKVYQVAASSKGEKVDYSQYKEFWAISFSATLSLWLIAYFVGRLLKFLK